MKNNFHKILLLVFLLFVLVLVSPNIIIASSENQKVSAEEVVFQKRIGVYTVSITALIANKEDNPVFIDILDAACDIPRLYPKRWLGELEYDVIIAEDAKSIEGTFFGFSRTYIGISKQLYINTDGDSVNFSITIDEFIGKERSGDIKMSGYEITAIIINALILIFYVAIFCLFLSLIIKNKK